MRRVEAFEVFVILVPLAIDAVSYRCAEGGYGVLTETSDTSSLAARFVAISIVLVLGTEAVSDGNESRYASELREAVNLTQLAP